MPDKNSLERIVSRFKTTEICPALERWGHLTQDDINEVKTAGTKQQMIVEVCDRCVVSTNIEPLVTYQVYPNVTCSYVHAVCTFFCVKLVCVMDDNSARHIGFMIYCWFCVLLTF